MKFSLHNYIWHIIHRNTPTPLTITITLFWLTRCSFVGSFSKATTLWLTAISSPSTIGLVEGLATMLMMSIITLCWQTHHGCDDIMNMRCIASIKQIVSFERISLMCMWMQGASFWALCLANWLFVATQLPYKLGIIQSHPQFPKENNGCHMQKYFIFCWYISAIRQMNICAVSSCSKLLNFEHRKLQNWWK